MGKNLIIAFDVIDDKDDASLLTENMYWNALCIPMSESNFSNEDCFRIESFLEAMMYKMCHHKDFTHLFPEFNAATSHEALLNDNIAHKFENKSFECSPIYMKFSYHDNKDHVV